MTRFARVLILALALACALVATASAGMPSPLPSSWTATSGTPSYLGGSTESQTSGFLQAFSFFVAVLLATAWAVKGLWNVVRKDLAWLPALTYWRALGIVFLWGLLFIVVLTMISGARELMTPGAWRKQGWTYKLADPADSVDSSHSQRHQALMQLRHALWHYAATNDGRFPPQSDPAVDEQLWNIPGWPGFRFLYVSDRTAGSAGQILVYEPELDHDDRQVLLTNGLIGEMRGTEIRANLADKKSDRRQ